MKRAEVASGDSDGRPEGPKRAKSVVQPDRDHQQPLHAPSTIAHKRDGGSWTNREVRRIVEAIVDEEMSREQIGALLMSVYLQGMSTAETVALTNAFVASGDKLSWPASYAGSVVDKHSTGGVGDKISLPLAPALAACGLKVPMISGRGLGHTGGTLDKLESIPGFRVEHSADFMRRTLDDVGCCIVGQTASLVPADKIVYGIRDVTATVGSVPLITASIVSKKVAEGLASLVLDVKVGRAAFMQSREDATALARSMVDAATGSGVKTVALLTAMDHPIGNAVGNALEVTESVLCLRGKGPDDLRELVCAEGGHLIAANTGCTYEEGHAKIQAVLDDGSALAKFEAMLVAQGTPAEVAQNLCRDQDDPGTVLPSAPLQTVVPIEAAAMPAGQDHAWVDDINAMLVAKFCCNLGAGRKVATDKVDFAVGMELMVQVGDKVSAGDGWVRVHHREPLTAKQHRALAQMIVIVPDARNGPPPRVLGIIE